LKQKTVTTNKAVLYARVSSKEQEREGYSIPAQKKLLHSYAQKHGYEIVKKFIDVETAKQSGRTQFNDMVQFLEEHPRVRIILCEKTDRLYRNFKDYVTIDELDVTLIFVKEGSVLNKYSRSHEKFLIFVKEGSVLNKYSRSHEKFIHGIKVLMAKNYIDNLSDETRKGLLEKAEEGEFPAHAPLCLGYLHDRVNKTIELDEKRAPIIREMFKLYATGEYSIRAIIDKALFDKVQAVISGKNRTRASVRGFAYTGLLKCAEYGCSITAEIKIDRYIYYHCTFDKGKCGGSYVREEELERQFGEILKQFKFSQVVFEWMREALRLSQQEKAEFHRKAIEKLNAQYLKLQSRIDQMYLDKLDGEIEEAFYQKHVRQRREEQDSIQEQIRQHQKADENYIEQGIKLLEIAKNAYRFSRVKANLNEQNLYGLSFQVQS